MKPAILVFAALGLVACNSIWGLDEGQIQSGSGGGTGSGGAPMTTTSTGQTGMGGAGGETSGWGGAGGSSGSGGGCVVDTGLLNGDFSGWAGSDPDGWIRIQYASMMFAASPPGLSSGLAFGVTDVGSDAYAGYHQTVTLKNWTQCVRLSGDAKKSTGTGRLTAKAVFGSQKLEVVTPSGTDFAPFSATCQPSAPVDTFNATLMLDQLTVGGTVTYQMHSVAFDEVCCTGSEPVCPTN